MNLKIAICDDSPQDQIYLMHILTTWAKSTGRTLEIRTFLNAEQFLFHYEEESDFQILLLDIEMGAMNGVELAHKLRIVNREIQIVFVTGYADYIAEGYEVDALHYLLKPIRSEKLIQVMEKAVANQKKSERFLLLKENRESVRLPVADIIYIEVFSHCCVIHTAEGITEIKTAIARLETELGPQFVRVHRSYLVNLEFIRRIIRTEIQLESGERVPLSRRKYTEVNLAFIQYFGERQGLK